MRLVLPELFLKEICSPLRACSKVAALDIGKKMIGVSVSDITRQFITPWGTLQRNEPRFSEDNIAKLSRSMDDIMNKEEICGIVIGYPVHTDGTKSIMCQEVIRLIYQLQNSMKSSIPCTLHDERYTTMDSRRLAYQLSGKRGTYMAHKDALAASYILQSFVDDYLNNEF